MMREDDEGGGRGRRMREDDEGGEGFTVYSLVMQHFVNSESFAVKTRLAIEEPHISNPLR